MKLLAYQIRNYQNIIDSGWIAVDSTGCGPIAR